MGNHAINLDERYKRKYIEMIKNYCSSLTNLKEEQSAFWPQVGEYYKRGGFLFIGRADKEWHTFSPVGCNPDKVAEGAEKESITPDSSINNCPLNWVVDYSGEDPQSKFWGTINRIVRKKIVDSNRWYSHIAYSNLYKLSPKGDKPSNKQCDIQEPYVFDLLDIEINEFQPKFIISLADYCDWTKDFINYRRQRIRLVERDAYEGIDFIGTEKIGGGMDMYWIVTSRHPQGMKRDDHDRMITSIVTAINKFQRV